MGELPPRAPRTEVVLSQRRGQLSRRISFRWRSSAAGINNCHSLDLSTPPILFPLFPQQAQIHRHRNSTQNQAVCLLAWDPVSQRLACLCGMSLGWAWYVVWEGYREETSALTWELHHKIAACITRDGAGNISQSHMVQVEKRLFPTVHHRDKLLNLETAICSEHIVLGDDRCSLFQGL